MTAGDKFHVLASSSVHERRYGNSHGYGDVRTQAEAQIVLRQVKIDGGRGGPAEAGDEFEAGHRQILSGTDKEGHSLPPPGVQLQPEGGEGLDFGVRGHALLLEIPLELTAHEVLRLDRRNGLEHLDLLIAERLAIVAGRRFHGQIAKHLKDMVLDDVANRARAIVEDAASLNPEVFRHGDLHALHMVAVPHLLHETVGEAKGNHIGDRALREIVIDTEDRGLIEGGMQDAVEFLRRSQVVTEGLLDDDAGSFGRARFYELLYNGLEEERRDGEVMRGPLRRAKCSPERLKCREIRIVAVYIAKQGAQLRPRVAIDSAVCFQAILGACFELVEVPAGLGYANHRNIELPVLNHRLQRREDLLVGQVASRSEKNECISIGIAHKSPPCGCPSRISSSKRLAIRD